jgi:hypothetical protein
MLLVLETILVVNDKEKRGLRFLKVFDADLKNLNQWLKPREAI